MRLCRNILDYLALIELIALLAGVHNQLFLVLVHLPARLGRFIRQIFRNFIHLLLHCAVLQRSVQRNIPSAKQAAQHGRNALEISALTAHLICLLC